MGSYKKKLFIALLLILLIGFFVCGSVNATMTNDIQYSVDQPTLLKQQQEYLASVFINRFMKYGDSTLKETLKTELSNNYYWPLFNYVTLNNSPYITLYLVPITVNYDNLNSYTLDTNDEYFYDTYFSYPVSGYSINGGNIGQSGFIRYVFNLSNNYNNRSTYTSNIFIPSAVIMYQNKTVLNFINGVQPDENVYLMIMQSIQDNTEQEEETTNELKKLNDFMKSDDVDDDAYDMPGNSDNPTQDITQNGVNNIFDIFYNEINNWESQNITVRIPFTNKFFYIPANLTENIIDTNFPAGAFKNLLGLIWYYLLAVYIIKDVQKYIDGLQTGEILTKSDTNIKTEML